MSETRVAYLASEATVRRRVFARFALGPEDIDRLAREVAILRVASYEGRLQQLADAAGHKGEVQLADPAVLRRIARESRDVAAGMVSNHNDDLRAWLTRQERGQSQRALGGAARQWAQNRAIQHGKTAAYNEGMWGRNQAVRDVLDRNAVRVRVRAEPRSAAEPVCAGIVAGGWYEHRAAPALPAHPRCRHSWATDTRLVNVLGGRDRVWLGDWLEKGE